MHLAGRRMHMPTLWRCVQFTVALRQILGCEDAFGVAPCRKTPRPLCSRWTGRLHEPP
jgi:hypothetical protein